MTPRKLLFAHHFPLSSVTGVTVILADLLQTFAGIDDVEAAYVSYDGCATPDELTELLAERYADSDVLVGMNLQIEVAWEFSVALMAWCRRSGVMPYVYVFDYWPQHRDATERLVTEYGARLLAATPFIQSLLADAGFASALLETGVPFLEAAPAPAVPSKGPKIVAAIGRLVARKRLHDAVRGFALAGLGDAARLYLKLLPTQTFGAGDDAEQFALVEREIAAGSFPAGSLEIDRVASETQSYAAFSIFVCPSSYEGFGLPAIQAPYAGCVPLLSDIPPHRTTAETLFGDDAGAFLFPVGDCVTLAELLRDEVSMGWRSALIAKRSAEIRALVDARWSMRTMALAFAGLPSAL